MFVGSGETGVAATTTHVSPHIRRFDGYETFRLMHGRGTNHETVKNFIRRAKAGRL
jgi:hypothetical protein